MTMMEYIKSLLPLCCDISIYTEESSYEEKIHALECVFGNAFVRYLQYSRLLPKKKKKIKIVY